MQTPCACQVRTSPTGDCFSPALTRLVPHLVSASAWRWFGIKLHRRLICQHHMALKELTLTPRLLLFSETTRVPPAVFLMARDSSYGGLATLRYLLLSFDRSFNALGTVPYVFGLQLQIDACICPLAVVIFAEGTLRFTRVKRPSCTALWFHNVEISTRYSLIHKACGHPPARTRPPPCPHRIILIPFFLFLF